jgi:uncharacterized protein YggT (Ycf19 family)
MALLARLLDAYQLLIVVWAITSWIPTRPDSPTDSFRSALGTLVEPYVGLFQRILPPVGGVDFSPILALLVLQILERVLL